MIFLLIVDKLLILRFFHEELSLFLEVQGTRNISIITHFVEALKWTATFPLPCYKAIICYSELQCHCNRSLYCRRIVV